MTKEELIKQMTCNLCKRPRGTVDGLCDDCTIKQYGRLFPFMDGKEIKK